jgi:chromosome partitioning protein
MVKSSINPTLAIQGILITMTDRTSMAKAVETALQKEYGSLVFNSKISRSVEATNSTYVKKSLVSEKRSKLGGEYMSLIDEFIERNADNAN